MNTANPLLHVVDLALIQPSKEFGNYISFDYTIRVAKQAGLSVGDYIDTMYNVPGATQQTIDEMSKLGVFSSRVERVCEIGPGSGRYLEKTLQACKPDYYEIYETAADWKKWLVQKYKVTAHTADGAQLASTPSCSIDLVQAHKVFPGLSILSICRYFGEMARVVRDNGKVVFDILTEGCLDDSLLAKWFASGEQYPCSMIAKQYAIDFFVHRGFSYMGSFFVDMKPGITEYFVFTKPAAD